MTRIRQAAARGWWILAPLAALAVYAPTLRFGFIWDDPLVLDQLRRFRSPIDLLRFPPGVPRFYYRPVTFASLLADRWLGGGEPLWFHASVVAAHAFAVALVYAVSRAVLPVRPAAAALGALLFAVHPVHVESVAWIAGRSDVLATVFLLMGLLIWLRGVSRISAPAAAAAMLFAILAKEVALVGIVLFPAAELALGKRVAPGRLAWLVAAVAVALGLRVLGLGSLSGAADSVPHPVDVLWALPGALGWYALQTVFPYRQVPWVPEIPEGGLWVSAGLLALVLSAVVAVAAWRRSQRALSFALLWYWAALAPSLLVVVRVSASAPVADRYLYLPSVALAFLVAWSTELLRGRARRAVGAAVLVLCGVSSLSIVARAEVWQDDLHFWSHLVAVQPDEPMPRRELAAAFLRRGDLVAAQTHLEEALRLATDPAEQVMTWTAWGNLALRQDRLDSAAEAFDNAIRLRAHPFALNGLARVEMRRAEVAQLKGDMTAAIHHIVRARDILRRSLQLDPQDDRSHALLGQVLLALGDRKDARYHFLESLRLRPEGPVAAINRRYLQQLAGAD